MFGEVTSLRDPWMPRRPGPPLDGGIVLDGYRDFEAIARSQSSEVYRAYQDGLDRPVAVKVLLRVDDPEAIARFRREIGITVRLGRQHPHIVSVIDTGTTAEGRLCIVMEYYDLGSLHDRLGAHGPLDPGEVLAAGTVVADALAFAHRHGVLHRDVKPQNILVLPTSYVIADFGIARGIDAAHTSSVEWFSFRHAAPQVLDGEPPSVADDVWALGSTLFTLLDGRPPFSSGDPDEDTGGLAYILRVRTGTPRPLDRPDVPPGLTAVIDRCLRREPADRYRDAAALHDALGALSVEARAWSPVVSLELSSVDRPATRAAITPPAPARAATPAPAPVPPAAGAQPNLAAADDLPTAAPPRPDAAAPVEEPPANGRRRRILVAALAAVVLGGLAGLVGTWLVRPDTDSGRGQPAATPAPVTNSANVNPQLAPAITRADRLGTTVALRWRDTTAGRASFIVVRIVGGSGTAVRSLPPATAEFVVENLAPAGPPYCFQVIAVVGREVGVSPQRCTGDG